MRRALMAATLHHVSDGSSREAPPSQVRRRQVGVGVLVLHNDEVLLGLRRGAHGAGTWSPPGGHLEFGEDPVACARREAFEEAGIQLDDYAFLAVTNDVFEVEGRHSVTLFYRTTRYSGTPSVREPDRCETWQWWPWDALPPNLFLPLQNLRRTGSVLHLG
jgi:8-oxo-dGTP diphosphatase